MVKDEENGTTTERTIELIEQCTVAAYEAVKSIVLLAISVAYEHT